MKDLKDLIIGIMKEIENLKIFVGKIVKDKYVNKMWNVVYGEFKFLLGYTVFRVNLFDRREEETSSDSSRLVLQNRTRNFNIFLIKS